jgi:DNA repair exonuclease SbcCD nuclease subunit
MPTLTFLQISDLHLDSMLLSGRLALPEAKARLRRDELRQILPRAARLARERRAQIVLIPGDLFDDEAVAQDTVNFVIDHLGALDPIPVVIAPGNHDFYSLGSPYNDDLLGARRQRRWPANVHIFRDGSWSTRLLPSLPGVTVTGMAHAANALLNRRLLADRIGRPEAACVPGGIHLLLFHGSRDHARLPEGKLRTLPFSEEELAAQGFDYAAVGHYHDHSPLNSADGRVLGAYAGCPAGRGVDEQGARHVLVGEVIKEGGVTRVRLEPVRLDPRAVRVVETDCTGATHREAIAARIEAALQAGGAAEGDLVHLRLTGRVPPGIDMRVAEMLPPDRFFHVTADLSALKPDYDVDRYRDGTLRTTEARFARELLGRLDAETDPARRRILENALYYGLDALLQKSVVPRYEA